MHEYTSLVLIFLFLISCICDGWFLAQKLAKTDRTSLDEKLVDAEKLVAGFLDSGCDCHSPK
jgi:hypothetical protein